MEGNGAADVLRRSCQSEQRVFHRLEAGHSGDQERPASIVSRICHAPGALPSLSMTAAEYARVWSPAPVVNGGWRRPGRVVRPAPVPRYHSIEPKMLMRLLSPIHDVDPCNTTQLGAAPYEARIYRTRNEDRHSRAPVLIHGVFNLWVAGFTLSEPLIRLDAPVRLVRGLPAIQVRRSQILPARKHH